MRTLSALASIICIPVVFLAGKLLGQAVDGVKVGLFASFLFAVSRFHIYYAQEARVYAILTLATSAVLCGVLWIFSHPREASRPLFARNPVRRIERNSHKNGLRAVTVWSTLILAASLSLWAHNMATLYVLTSFFVLAAWALSEPEAGRPVFLHLLAAGLMVTILCSPFFYFLIHQFRMALNDFWLPKPTLLYLMNTLADLFGPGFQFGSLEAFPLKEVVRAGMLASLFALAGAGIWDIHRKCGFWIAALIICLIVMPILTVAALSLTLRPLLISRTMIFVCVPFYLAVSAGIMCFRNRRLRTLILLAVAFLFIRASFNYYSDQPKEPWDRIASLINREARPGDALLLLPNHVEVPFSFYAGTRKTAYDVIPLPEPYETAYTETRLRRQRPRISARHIPMIEEAISGRPSVWLISRLSSMFDPEDITLNTLRRKKALTYEWHSYDIAVYKFE